MTDDLSVFSEPRSVAVVGASADPAKWGHWLALGALRGPCRRSVHLVNARSAVIEGVVSAPALRDLPEVPDLVVLCTPAATIPGVVNEALDLGVRGFLGITAGLDSADGTPGYERRLAERVRSAGARFVGPNCLGLYDAATGLELAWGRFEPGSLGIVSQSGQVGLEIAGLAAHAGIGVSRFVSVGNQIDVTATDVLEDLVAHPMTRAVVLYLEDFSDGRALVATTGRLCRAGKPVVVLTVGASEASRAAARSHTGAMTASTDVVGAACRAAGAVLVETPTQAVDLVHLLLGGPLPQGRRVAIVSDSGGQGALAADTVFRQGLTVPRLSGDTANALTAILPSTAAVANPVDLAGAGERDLRTYSSAVELLLDSGEIDSVVLSGYFGSYGRDAPALVQRELDVVDTLAELVRRHGKPVVVHSMSHDSPAVRSMRAKAVPTLQTIDGVARSLRLAVDMYEHRDAADLGNVGRTGSAAGGKSLTYLPARDRIASAGIAFPRAVGVRSVEDLRAAVSGLTAPLVLKAGWVEHKTEVGGVATGLVDIDAAAAAFREMSARLGHGEYVLEEMDRRPDVVELVVGARRDPSFGPLVLVGLGGAQAELYRDVQIALAPVTEARALGMLANLRGYALLQGWRGRPAVDIRAAAGGVAAVSRLIAGDENVVECEINPLRVAPAGAVAVDALVVVDAAGAGRA